MTADGRIVAVGLIVVGVSLFGVITAAVAAWFVRRVQDDPEPEGDDLAGRLARVEATLGRIESALIAQTFERSR